MINYTPEKEKQQADLWSQMLTLLDAIDESWLHMHDVIWLSSIDGNTSRDTKNITDYTTVLMENSIEYIKQAKKLRITINQQLNEAENTI